MNRRAIAVFFIVIVILLPIMASCADVENSNLESLVSEISTDETSTSRKDAKDNLPEKSFGGRDFVIFCRSENLYEFEEEETATEYVNDIIQRRNERVEERFDVKIKTFAVAGNWGVHTDFFTTLRSYIDGGGDDFQLIAGYAAIIPSVISENLFYNWHDIDYIDLEQPWWSKDLNKELTINNKLFILTGDISLSLWENMCAMFFNKKMANDNDIPDLYDLVKSGGWTFDKMAQYAKLAAKDDGDGVVTKDDTFGYISALTTQVDVYQDAFDLSITQKNSNGIPEFTMSNSKTYNAVEMLYDFLLNNSHAYTDVDSNIREDLYSVFGEERALFMPAKLKWAEYINQYEMEYGILPMPKYDEAQDGYYTSSIDNFSMLAVPNTVKDTDFVGIITEALCAESYRNVVEDYYQTILRSRYVNDPESAEMVDIVREGLRFNFGYIYSYTLEWPAHQVNVCLNNNTKDFVSLWDSKEEIFKKNLEDHLKVYLD